MSRRREAGFEARFWDKLNRYLEKYSVDGNTLIAKELNSVVVKGKVPDIVVKENRGF